VEDWASPASRDSSDGCGTSGTDCRSTVKGGADNEHGAVADCTEDTHRYTRTADRERVQPAYGRARLGQAIGNCQPGAKYHRSTNLHFWMWITFLATRSNSWPDRLLPSQEKRQPAKHPAHGASWDNLGRFADYSFGYFVGSSTNLAKLVTHEQTSAMVEVKALHIRILADIFLGTRQRDDINIDDFLPD